MINIQENVSLAAYSTMRLGGTARYVLAITSEEDLLEALQFINDHQLPYKMIGSGSNIIWSGDYSGVLLVNALKGFLIQDTLVTAKAGEQWDFIVESSVLAGLSGIECLSLIPGTVGATPVQNVGAYGVEIKDVLVSVRAYDTSTKEFVVIDTIDCNFGYRTSRFNGGDVGRFLITELTMQLKKTMPKPPFYKALEEYLLANSITDFTPATIRSAVIAIRKSKLPDPEKIPNCGSFFKNPLMPQLQVDELLKKYPAMPYWPQDDTVKLSAAWLLDQAGFKDYKDPSTGMATFSKQPLVVINESAKTSADLMQFKQHLQEGVFTQFGIMLEQEPELV